MKTIFFVGNKRSGTTLAVRLLNRHPNIYIPRESDIGWLLMRIYKYGDMKLSPYDGSISFDYILKHCHNMFGDDIVTEVRKKTPMESFVAIQKHLQKAEEENRGSPKTWKNIKMLGDKKPNQHVNPELMKFTAKHFKPTLLIHLVRHPMQFVGSCIHRKITWFGKTRQDMLNWWEKIEVAVLKAKKAGYPILTMRYEDLCNRPHYYINVILKRCGLDYLKNQVCMNGLRGGLDKKHKHRSYTFRKLAPRFHSEDLMSLTPQTKEIVKMYRLMKDKQQNIGEPKQR